MKIHVSKRLGIVIGVAVAVVVIAVLVAASVRSVSQTPWTLTAISPDGRSLSIEVKMGSSSCIGFDRTTVTEDTDEVQVQTYASRKVLNLQAVCTADAQILRLDVQLEEPLGERLLTGCLQSTNCSDT